MLPELAPYALTTLMLALFSALAVQAGRQWNGSLYLPIVLGVLLVLSGVHLPMIPLLREGSDLAFTANEWVHWLLLLPLPALLACGVYRSLCAVVASDPK